MPLFSKPQYSRVTASRKDIPKGLWSKCPISGEIIYNKELEQNLMVVPKSGYHFPLSAPARIASLIDQNTWIEHDQYLQSVDPLNFTGPTGAYPDKLKQYEKKTGISDAVLSGEGELSGIRVNLAVMDFRFLGASMGSVVGERITRTIERGLKQQTPVIIVCTSGGARMYEGILSLMQMAKTSAALARLADAGLPYISILTNPTMAGVMASFASLGDLIIAEPGALVGFAGPRVIKETTQTDLPEGFQTSEFLLERGLIDQIIPRHELKTRLTRFLALLTGLSKEEIAAVTG
ncbi:MAG: acetyl-CoA carboxylase, carboxyltransferase subunit beta [Puniceicoccaceae bacterium]